MLRVRARARGVRRGVGGPELGDLMAWRHGRFARRARAGVPGLPRLGRCRRRGRGWRDGWPTTPCTSAATTRSRRDGSSAAGRCSTGVPPSADYGWLLVIEGYYALEVDADPETAATKGAEAAAWAPSCSVPDLEALGIAIEGAARVVQGRVDEGLRRLDEAAAVCRRGGVRAPDLPGMGAVHPHRRLRTGGRLRQGGPVVRGDALDRRAPEWPPPGRRLPQRLRAGPRLPRRVAGRRARARRRPRGPGGDAPRDGARRPRAAGRAASPPGPHRGGASALRARPSPPARARGAGHARPRGGRCPGRRRHRRADPPAHRRGRPDRADPRARAARARPGAIGGLRSGRRGAGRAHGHRRAARNAVPTRPCPPGRGRGRRAERGPRAGASQPRGRPRSVRGVRRSVRGGAFAPRSLADARLPGARGRRRHGGRARARGVREARRHPRRVAIRRGSARKRAGSASSPLASARCSRSSPRG